MKVRVFPVSAFFSLSFSLLSRRTGDPWRENNRCSDNKRAKRMIADDQWKKKKTKGTMSRNDARSDALTRNINAVMDAVASAVNQEKAAREPSDIYLKIELGEINIRVCFTLIYCKNGEIVSCGARPGSRVYTALLATCVTCRV
jgi:hypothetical protein